jgi:hypothetical protein
MKVDMMPCSQDRVGTSSEGGSFGLETDFSAWSEVSCTQSDRRTTGGV